MRTAMSTASGLINPIAVPLPLVGMKAPSASFPTPSGASPSEADISGSLCEVTLRSAAAAGNARGNAATERRAFIASGRMALTSDRSQKYENPIPQNRNLCYIVRSRRIRRPRMTDRGAKDGKRALGTTRQGAQGKTSFPYLNRL